MFLFQFLQVMNFVINVLHLFSQKFLMMINPAKVMAHILPMNKAIIRNPYSNKKY